MSQGERGVVGGFDQALTRLSGFFFVRSIPVHAVGLGMPCALGSQAIRELSAARVLPPRLPGSWRQGAWQLPEGRCLGGGIPPAASVVENGDL